MTDHDHLRTLAENATPGPWEFVQPTDTEASVYNSEGDAPIAWEQDWHHAGVFSTADAEFIAAANPVTVLALLDELAAVTAERDAYRRGQGPAPTPATPGTTALHETHPIPNSRGDDQ